VPWEQLWILYFYRDGVSKWIKRIKEGRRPELWRELKKDVMPVNLPDFDGLVALPSEPLNTRHRGFDASNSLGRRVSVLTGIRHLQGVLVRKPDMLAQKKRSSWRRSDAASQLFQAGPEFTRIKGRNILLIDDVMTSGSSLRSCAELLQSAVRSQSALVVARVPRAKL